MKYRALKIEETIPNMFVYKEDLYTRCELRTNQCNEPMIPKRAYPFWRALIDYWQFDKQTEMSNLISTFCQINYVVL